MAKPKFVSGINELQFSRGMQYPVAKPIELMQAVDRTAAGTLEVENQGGSIRTRPLPFRNLPKDDYDNLVIWFTTICNGAENPFTYFDEQGQSMTVLMLTSPFDFKETSYQRYSGELLLELV